MAPVLQPSAAPSAGQSLVTAPARSARLAATSEALENAPQTDLRPEPSHRLQGERSRRIIRDSLIVTAGSYVAQGFGVVTSVALRMLLDPALMGVWSGVKTFLSYTPYLNLGISKGAARDVPILLARGQADLAQRALDLAFTVNTLTSVLGGVIFWVAAWYWPSWYGGPFAGYWAAGLVAAGVLVILQRYYTFFITSLRAYQRFPLIAGVGVVEAVLTLALAGIGTYLFGLLGLLGATVVVTLVASGMLQRQSGLRFRFAWEGREMLALIAVGWPILLSGVLYSLLCSIDKLMIMWWLPDREHQLGCYSAALLVTGQLYGVGNLLGTILYPRYQQVYGETSDPARVARLCAIVTETLAVFLAPCFGLALLAGPALLGRIMPEYAAGFPALYWLLPGSLLLTIAQPSSHYLITVDRQGRLVTLTVVAIAAAGLAGYFALRAGGGILGVAGGAAVSYGAYFVLLEAASLGRVLSRREAVRHVLRWAGPILFLSVAVAVLEAIWPWPGASLRQLAYKGGLFVVCAALPVWQLDRRTGVVRLTWEVILRGASPTRTQEVEGAAV